MTVAVSKAVEEGAEAVIVRLDRATPRRPPPPTRRAPASRPSCSCPRARSPRARSPSRACTARSCSRCAATSTRRSPPRASSRDRGTLRARQLPQPVPARGPEDGGLRDRRGARRGARRDRDLPYGGGGNTTAYGAGFARARRPAVAADRRARPRDRRRDASRRRSGSPSPSTPPRRPRDQAHGGRARHARRRRDPRRLGRPRAHGGPLLRAVVGGRARRARRTSRRPGRDGRRRPHGPRAQGPGERRGRTPRPVRGRCRSGRDRRGRRAADDSSARPRPRPTSARASTRAAVAFDLWNELEVTDGEGVVVEGEGAAELPADDSNLAVRAYALLADPAGKRFRFVNRIPLERGLGSSAAAIALGLVAAAPRRDRRGAAGGRRSRSSRTPTTSAAALLGGLTLSWDGTDRPDRGDACRSTPIALIPHERTSTESLRGNASRHACRTPKRRRAPAAPRCSAPVRRAATPRSSPPRSTTGCTSPTAPPRRSTAIRAEPPAGLRRRDAVRLGPDRDRVGPPTRGACAAELAERASRDHEVLELDVAPRGAL